MGFENWVGVHVRNLEGGAFLDIWKTTLESKLMITNLLVT